MQCLNPLTTKYRCPSQIIINIFLRLTLWNNIIQKLQGNNLSPENRSCLCLLKITWHALTKTSASNPSGIFREFWFIAQSVWNAINVIHRAIIWASPKLVSLINHNTACTTLKQWNIPLGGKMAQGGPFCPRVGAKWSNSIFFNFRYISKI